MLKLLKRTLMLMLPFLWKGRDNLIASIATLCVALTSVLVHTATPQLLGYVLKAYQDQSVYIVLAATLLLLLCWCANFALRSLRAIIFFRVINQAIRDIRLRVVMQLHQVPVQVWEQYGVTEIMSTSTRVASCVRRCMSISFVTIFPTTLKIIAFSIALVCAYPYTWYFPPLAVLSHLMVYMDVIRLLTFRAQLWNTADQVNTAMDDSLHSTKFARFHVKEEEERLSALFDKEAKGWLRNNFEQHKIALIQSILFSITLGLLVIPIMLRMRAGQLTVPDFVVIKGYAFGLHYHINKISVHLRNLLNSTVDLKKILDLLALPTRTVTDSATSTAIDTDSATSTATDKANCPILQAKDVYFAYSDGTAVLKGLVLDINKGDRVAIVGNSGTGKSTLCHLLSGIYQPHRGEILLDGIPMQQLPLATVGKRVHFVDQDANMIKGSIAENLVVDDSALQAAPLAYLKSRLHDDMGDAGKKLSSGERQRVLLARCLSYKPEVLILDETLSALDEESAQALLQLIFKSVPTVIFVTHRMSLVKQFKCVYRLESGKLKQAQC